jgi:hypothetical protein
MHGAIEYVSVVVSASARKGAAEKVQQAMLGEKVQAAFKEAGFLQPPAPATTQK